jgi:hypothetical protein
MHGTWALYQHSSSQRYSDSSKHNRFNSLVAATKSPNDSFKWSFTSIVLVAVLVMTSAVGAFAVWANTTETEQVDHVAIDIGTDLLSHEPTLETSAYGFEPNS